MLTRMFSFTLSCYLLGPRGSHCGLGCRRAAPAPDQEGAGTTRKAPQETRRCLLVPRWRGVVGAAVFLFSARFPDDDTSSPQSLCCQEGRFSVTVHLRSALAPKHVQQEALCC